MSASGHQAAAELATDEQLASLRELLRLASEEEPNEVHAGHLLRLRDTCAPGMTLLTVCGLVNCMHKVALPGGELDVKARIAWRALPEERRWRSVSSARWFPRLVGHPDASASKLVATLEEVAGRPMREAEIEALAVGYSEAAMALRRFNIARSAERGESVDNLIAIAAHELTRWLERHAALFPYSGPLPVPVESIVLSELTIDWPRGWWANVDLPGLEELWDGDVASDGLEALHFLIARIRQS